MSRRILYKCDSCGHSWEGSANKTGQDELWSISIEATNAPTQHDHRISVVPNEGDPVAVEWCRDCVVHAGLTKPNDAQRKRKVEPLIEGKTQSQRVEGLLQKLAQEIDR